MGAATEQTKPAAVYVSWVTFKNAIEGLAKSTVPNKIDKSVFPGLSGGVQSQLFAGLRFLGLINGEDRPTQTLIALAAPDEATRKAELKKLLEAKYKDVFELGLAKTTPNELTERMAESYGVGGDTREKAVRFFLSAIEYLGIAVSPHFKSKTVSASPGNTRRRRRTNPARPNERPASVAPAVAGGSGKTIRLQSGGDVSVGANVDLFTMSAEDRAFVFGLIDQLSKYEGEHPVAGDGDDAAE